jgi:hypothetical protein
MSNDPVYDFLYCWVDQVINQEMGCNIPIMQSHQPKQEVSQQGTFISIDYAPNRTKVGRSSKCSVDENGNRIIVNDYEYVIEIWETNGNGQHLEALLNSLERSEIEALWSENNYVFYGRNTDIINLPRTQENNWKKECLIELEFGTAKGVQDKTGYINDVGISGDIPAQGRSGEHTVEI